MPSCILVPFLPIPRHHRQSSSHPPLRKQGCWASFPLQWEVTGHFSVQVEPTVKERISVLWCA